MGEGPDGAVQSGGGEDSEQDGQQHQQSSCPYPIIAIAARIPNGHLIGAVVAFVYGYGGMFAAGNMTLAN